MKKVLVVGGANGIGLTIVKTLTAKDEIEKVYVLDKVPLAELYLEKKIESQVFDLTNADYSVFGQYSEIDTLIVTAGFGRLDLFQDIPEEMIATYFNVNTIAVIRIIKHFYDKLLSQSDFYCGILVSISGMISSPFFSLYSATKAALHRFIESVNVELEKSGSKNRILNVSPGAIKGTRFYGGENDLFLTQPLAKEILESMWHRELLYIPRYEEVYRDVIARYQTNPHQFGLESYDYKVKTIKNR